MAKLFRIGACVDCWMPSRNIVQHRTMAIALPRLCIRTYNQSMPCFLCSLPAKSCRHLSTHHSDSEPNSKVLCKGSSCHVCHSKRQSTRNSFHLFNVSLSTSLMAKSVYLMVHQNTSVSKLCPNIIRSFTSRTSLDDQSLIETDNVASSRDKGIEMDGDKPADIDLNDQEFNPELLDFYSQFATEFDKMNPVNQESDEPFNTPNFDNATLAVTVDRISKDTHIVTSDPDYGADIPSTIQEIHKKEVTLPRKVGEKSALRPVFNLAGYVNQSETLTNLVKVGVDLSVVELVPGAANLIIKLDFERDIQPYLLFLHDVGVSDDELGSVLTKNPLIFKEHIDDLKVRVNYLESMKFSQEAITRIIVKSPRFFSMRTVNVDRRLGYYQKEFHLTGNEVRLAITRLPKLISWKHHQVKDIRFHMLEFLGFSEMETKEIFLTQPKIFLSNRHKLLTCFDYLYNTMGLTHKQLTQWPDILRTRLHLIKNRHLFLLHQGRAQYDATKENYVSLKALATRSDSDFCVDVAKASVSTFNDFMKTV